MRKREVGILLLARSTSFCAALRRPKKATLITKHKVDVLFTHHMAQHISTTPMQFRLVQLFLYNICGVRCHSQHKDAYSVQRATNTREIRKFLPFRVFTLSKHRKF